MRYNIVIIINLQLYKGSNLARDVLKVSYGGSPQKEIRLHQHS